MCRTCGAIVGAGEAQCAVCGASTASHAAPKRPRLVADRETMRFARAVLNRPHKFTIILLVANIFVFLLMWQSSGMTFSVLGAFPPQVLVAYGAKLNLLIDTQHQWWRLVTPMFLHVNLLHLTVNMYSLWIVGPYVEKLYGSAKFIVFWVVTGVAANIASYLTVVDPGTSVGPLARFLFRPDLPSAGASGALFGLVGVLFVFGIKFRHELPEGFKRAFGTGLLPMILLNLFIGYLGRGLFDNAAHIGGLLSGAALALVVGYQRPGRRASIAVSWQVLQIIAIGVVAVSFLRVAQHLKDPLPGLLAAQAAETSSDPVVTDFLVYAQAMNRAQEAFYETLQENPKSADDALKKLEAAPHLDEKSAELKETLKLLLLEAQRLHSDPSAKAESSPRNAQLKQRQDLIAAFVSWSKQYNQWLRTSGKKYGGLIEASEPSPAPK